MEEDKNLILVRRLSDSDLENVYWYAKREMEERQTVKRWPPMHVNEVILNVVSGCKAYKARVDCTLIEAKRVYDYNKRLIEKKQ